MSDTTKPKRRRYVLGGYDAKNCPERLRKTMDPSYADVEKDPIPAGDMARMSAGVVFEAALKPAWRKALGRKMAMVDECDRTPASKAKREQQTLALLADPGDVLVIWNARLPQQFKTHRTGEPDALLLVGRGADGRPQWIPIDAKDHASLEGTRNRVTYSSSLRKPHPDSANIVDLGGGSPRKADALQLAHYQRMLEHLGFASDRNIGGIIGREMQVVWHDLTEPLYRHHAFKVASALEYYDYEFSTRVAIADKAMLGLAERNPEWKSECHSCEWRSTCHDELKVDMDHITLLPGITPLRAKAHYEQGLTTRKQLAKLNWATASLVDAKVPVDEIRQWGLTEGRPRLPISDMPGIKPAHVAACIAAGVTVAADAAELDEATAAYAGSGVWNLAGSIDQARVAIVGKVHRARGVDSVGFTRVGIEEDIDIEDYQGYVYMIGVRDTGRKTVNGNIKARAEYHSFVNWDGTEDGEARVFAEFWAHTKKMKAKAVKHKCGIRTYYFTHHEPSSFRKLAVRHAGKPGVPTLSEVEAYFASDEVVDLAPVVSQDLIWPTESMTLKELAKWVRFSWRDSDPGGGNSMAWYQDAISHPDETVREENRARLLEYNADDVEAQIAIRDWLTRLGEARQPGAKLPSVAALDRRASLAR